MGTNNQSKRGFIKNDFIYEKFLICPICTIHCRKLGTHLQLNHNLNLEKTYVKYVLKFSQPPTCACGCGGEVKFYGWRQGYSTYSTKCRPTSWLKGLTKETDQRVQDLAKSSSKTLKEKYKNGEIISCNKGKQLSEETKLKLSSSMKKAFVEGRFKPWRKGLTNENPAVSAASIKCSETLKDRFKKNEIKSWRTSACQEKMLAWNNSHSKNLKEKYASGEFVSWVEGLTSDQDERIRLKSEKIKLTREKLKEAILDLTWCKILSLEEGTNPGLSSFIEVECEICHHRINDVARNILKKTRCPKCYPNCSTQHYELFNWVKTIDDSAILNDRSQISPYELDILCLKKKFAIEFNGLYYHSNIDSTYHEQKRKNAKNAGISLFHIFEDEWRDKQDLIKSMICHRLILTQNTIGARKCTIRLLTKHEKKQFFEKNHIDGNVRSSICWGLIHNNEIVAAASFRKSFHKKWQNHIELARFATKLNTSVPGGYQKFLTHAKKYFSKPLLTYVDNRFGGNRETFEKMGLKFCYETKPRFWWTDKKNRYDRFKCKADKFNNITQSEMAQFMNLREIYGCSNMIFEFV